MNNPQLYLEGIDVTAYTELKSLKLQIGLNNSGQYGLTTSGQIVSEQNDLFYQVFVDGNKGNIMTGQLLVNELDFVLPIEVHPNSVEICGCNAEFMLTTSQDDKGRCYKEFGLRTITDGQFIDDIESKGTVRYLAYNLDFSGLLAIIANTVTTALAIPGIVAAILGKGEELRCLVTGTCRGHAVHKVNDMLEFIAKKCKKNLKSSVLYDDQYRNAYMLAGAIGNAEITLRPAPKTYDAKNYSDVTITEFLDEYVQLFNAEWRFQNDDLVIEHWTFFINQAVELDVYIEDPCFTIIDQCAALSLKYTDDNDVAGNTASGEYDERINFVQKDNYIQTEVCEVQPRLGRMQGTLSRTQDKQKVKYFTSPINPVALISARNAEISMGIAQLPKVFNIEGEEQGLVIPNSRPIPGLTNRFQFNYDFSFDEDDPNSLTNRWYYTEFPDSGFNRCFAVPNLALALCKELFTTIMDAFDQSKTVYVKSRIGNIYFNRGQIDFNNGTIILVDGVVYG